MQAIILTGGKGRRLLPYTTILPKPLMPLGDYPILEVILKQLKNAGFEDIVVSTGYLHEIICAYLYNRKELGMNIRYSHENKPLGTIAPLHLIDDLEENFLVMNGDILTDIDFSRIMDYHLDKKSIATVATFKRNIYVDFGVLGYDQNSKINRFIEKPTYNFDVSMGIYIFNREILNHIPKEVYFGFDDLMNKLLNDNIPVFSYPYEGYWLDIGRPDDYEISIEEFEKNKDKFLK